MNIFRFFILLTVMVIFACSHPGGTEKNNILPGSMGYDQDTAFINQTIRNCLLSKSFKGDSLITALRKAHDLAVRINFTSGAAESLFQQGELNYRLNNYKYALECYNDARLIAEESSNYLLKAKCLERMGSVNLSIGDDHRALNLYYESLPLFEQTGNKEGIAKVYNIIGVNRSSQGEYDSAISYFAKARKINEEIGNQTGVIHNDGNLAFMYHNMGDTEKAKEIYLSLIPSLIGTGDSINLSVIYYHLSIFSETASQPDSTLFYLRKALTISQKLADTSLLTTLYGKIGQIFLNKHQYDSAFHLLTISLEMAEAIDDYVTQKQVLKLLVSMDTLKGDYKKATAKYAKILIAGDSVHKQRLRNNLEVSELRYENQKKTNLIEVQDIKLELANRQKQFLIFLVAFSLVLTLLLAMLIVTMKRNNKRKHELLAEKLMINELQLKNAIQTEEINKLKIENAENELSVKENELVSNALALEQKNELLGQINNKINEAMSGDGILSIKDLNGIVSAIKVQINETDIFNQKFNQLHHDFFNNLKKLHPELTKSELKFCAYLKLHLESNQIASIMNVTNEAIRKTRYRIRKKLSLNQEDSLEDYISRF